MRVLLVKAVYGKEKEISAATCQNCDFSDLREVHTQLFDNAGIDYELAALQTLTGFVIVTVQHSTGLLYLLAQLLIGGGKISSFLLQ